jgi:hypothetical protein
VKNVEFDGAKGNEEKKPTKHARSQNSEARASVSLISSQSLYSNVSFVAHDDEALLLLLLSAMEVVTMFEIRAGDARRRRRRLLARSRAAPRSSSPIIDGETPPARPATSTPQA